MAKMICGNCKTEFDVPEKYKAPFIQCPDCRSVQKFERDTSGEPKFKVLDEKGRERVGKNVGDKGRDKENKNKNLVISSPPPENTVSEQVDTKKEARIIGFKKLLLDTVGEEGLKLAYTLAAKYMGFSSEKKRKNGRARAIRQFMREKYTAEMAAKAIEFAEQATETQAIIKDNRTKSIVAFAIIAVVVVVVLGLLL